MEKITMIIWHSPDYCTNCKSNSLRVVTDKGHSTSVLEVDMSNKFKIYKKIICSKCGKEYDIDWRSKEIRPLYDTRLKNNFLQQWKQ